MSQDYCCEEFKEFGWPQCLGQCVVAPFQRTNQERREAQQAPGAAFCLNCGGTGCVPHHRLPVKVVCPLCDGYGAVR